MVFFWNKKQSIIIRFLFFFEKSNNINNNHGSGAKGRVKNEISNYQLPWLRGEAKVTVHRTNMKYEIFCFYFYEYGKAKKVEKDRRRKPESQHWRQPGWLLSFPTVGNRSQPTFATRRTGQKLFKWNLAIFP